jgi:transposase
MKIIQIIHADAGPVHKKYHVKLTEEERAELRKLVTTGRVAARKRKHAEILLAADASAGGPAMVDADIRAKYDVGLAAIARVRQRLVEEGLDAALSPRPHLNLHARKVDGDAEAHLIALACSPPPQGHIRWTLRLLAERFIQLDQGCDISYETVRRVLGKK